jgi:hypothetical protein
MTMPAPCTLERRFEDCQRNDDKTHEALWKRLDAVENALARVTLAMATSRGAALVLHGVVTLICTAGGIKLISVLWP